MFSDEEVRQQLKEIGYDRVPQETISIFRKDLNKMVEQDSKFAKPSDRIVRFGGSGTANDISLISDLSDSTMNRSSSRQMVKRKVLRNGPSSMKYVDESFHDVTSSFDADLTDRMDNMYLDEPESEVHDNFRPLPSTRRSVNSSSSSSSTRPAKSKLRLAKPVYLNDDESLSQLDDTLTSQHSNLPLDRSGSAHVDDNHVATASPQISKRPSKQTVSQPVANERPLSAADVEPPTGETSRRKRITSTSSDGSIARRGPFYGAMPPDRLNASAASSDANSCSVIWQQSSSGSSGEPRRRHDPVGRFRQYASAWSRQRAPGEKAHKALRWDIREQMLYFDPVVQKRQRPVATPNAYIVPTDKQRKELRWQVRADMAQGRLPQQSTAGLVF